MDAYRNTLFGQIDSLLMAKRFPVPVSREFDYKPLKLLRNLKQKSLWTTEFRKIPC
jgi:hypothetical protein